MKIKQYKILKICFEKLKYFRYADRTIEMYIHYIEKFLDSTNKNHQHLTFKDFTSYLIGFEFSSVSQQNQIISSIKFLYEKVLNKKYAKIDFTRPRKKKTLPRDNRCVLVRGKGISIDLAWRLDSNNYNWCKYHGGENFKKWQSIEMWQYPPD